MSAGGYVARAHRSAVSQWLGAGVGDLLALIRVERAEVGA